MKTKVLLSLACMFLLLSGVKAQTVNDVPIKDLDAEYLQIVGTAKLLSNKVTIELDFGQLNKVFVGKDTQVKDAEGKLMVFNSMIDALNFFTKYGYEFVQAYAISVTNGPAVYHYLMKKKV